MTPRFSVSVCREGSFVVRWYVLFAKHNIDQLYNSWSILLHDKIHSSSIVIVQNVAGTTLDSFTMACASGNGYLVQIHPSSSPIHIYVWLYCHSVIHIIRVAYALYNVVILIQMCAPRQQYMWHWTASETIRCVLYGAHLVQKQPCLANILR